MNRGTGAFRLGGKSVAMEFPGGEVWYSASEIGRPRDKRGRFRKRRHEAGFGVLATGDLPINDVTNPGHLAAAGSAGLRILPPKLRSRR